MKETGEIMSSKTYLWIEDRKGKAGFLFWETFMQQLFPHVIVESRKNNTELVKAVKALKDQENQYIIVLDNAFDNLQVYREQKLLKTYADKKSNVMLLNILCFEYLLLEFDKLIDWIYASDDEFIIKRTAIIEARKMLVHMIGLGEFNYKEIREIITNDNYTENYNIEQLSARLLYDLTRNTGFEVSKGKIGKCWIRSCCDWPERQEDDICGLNDNRLSVLEKMTAIYYGTSLRKEFPKTGLEVSV